MTTKKQQTVSTESLLYDQGFNHFSSHNIETEEDIFFLGEDAKAFVHDTIEPVNNEVNKVETLVHTVFDRTELNLLYQANANTVANDTFMIGEANCLSMSIMTYAFVKEAGFNVDFQEVLIPEYWTRRQGYSFLNGHINLKYTPTPHKDSINFRSRSFQIDFDPQSSRGIFPKKIISKKAVIAMFYNNKGAEALVKNQHNLAYAYFREAALTYRKFGSTWINMGILYRKNGYFDQAKNAYLQALEQEPNNLTAWENLAYLYQLTGEVEKAQDIITRVESQRGTNPYYHVNLGEQEMELHNWSLAIRHFKKAISLNRHMHEGYYGLARVYFEIGELDESQRYLKLAKTKSINEYYEEKYQNKLDFLSSL